MSNTLTQVLADMYMQGLVTVPREKIGALMAVTRNFGAEQASQNDVVKVPVVPSLAAATVTPGATFASGSGRAFGSRQLTLNNFEEVSWFLTAEEERALQNSQNAQDIAMQTISQGIRTLANRVEASVLDVAYKNSTRAAGAASADPFASNLSNLAAAVGILDDNGVASNRHAVINTAAKVQMLGLTQLTNANQAGSDELLRQGALADLFDVMIHQSAQVKKHTKGTGADYLVNEGDGLPVGTTVIPLDTGTGTIVAGDVITFAADTVNKYVVTKTLGGGELEIAGPGLLVAIPDDNAVTVGDSYAANLVLHEGAVAAAIRPALQPESEAFEQSVVTDPMSGISALLIRVPQNAQTSFFLRIVYGTFAPNPYAIATLLGKA